jgi:nucleoside-diphosphate-sugar epimerase
MNTQNPSVVIYGGNGFVGCQIAKTLHSRGAIVSCVSRTGAIPAHLHNSKWAQSITWVQGDALKPDPDLLDGMDALITVVGSPPIPTFSAKAYQRQLTMNGKTNTTVIKAAADAGISRVILLGAKIPSLIDSSWFAYALGKRQGKHAAFEFSKSSQNHSAVVVQPGAIYGVRHTRSGSALPIDILMRPLAKLLPSQLVSVESVAGCIANKTLQQLPRTPSFEVIEHTDITSCSALSNVCDSAFN